MSNTKSFGSVDCLSRKPRIAPIKVHPLKVLVQTKVTDHGRSPVFCRVKLLFFSMESAGFEVRDIRALLRCQTLRIISLSANTNLSLSLPNTNTLSGCTMTGAIAPKFYVASKPAEVIYSFWTY